MFHAPTAAYIHIPFCRRRCYYCDFPVSVVGDHARGETSGTVAQYIEVLCQEIRATPPENQPLETIFFGGGTPSLLSVEQLAQVLEALNQQFGINPQAEISMEIDPGTFDVSHLQGYLHAGVNRISLGAQAFQPELLQLCGRSHTVADIYTAVDLIRQTGVANFSLDLISGLPHQTLDQWQDSLKAAIAIAPAHLSAYDLIVEPITAFSRQYQPGESPLPSDTLAADMYRLAQNLLTQAGYEHYEISNYAKPGYQCRHNRVYWQNRSYYGFGMGAASYVAGQRFTRPRKTREYFEWVEAFQANSGKIDCPSVPAEEIILDTLMLGLRLGEGMSVERLRAQFGEVILAKIWQCLYPHWQQGWVEVIPPPEGLESHTPPQQGRLCLSDPEGFLFSNTVLASVFQAF